MRFAAVVVRASVLATCAGLAGTSGATTTHQSATPPQSPVVIAQGTPLRIALDQRVSLKNVGARVDAHLVEPVYVGSTLLLAVGAHVSGELAAATPLPRSTQWQARFAGDFTPLKRPVLLFDQATLPGGILLHFQTLEATPAGAEIHFRAKVRRSLGERVRSMIHDRVQSAENTAEAPDKLHRAFSFLLGQLPYHSQFVPRDAYFDADLAEPVTVAEAIARDPVAPAAPVLQPVSASAPGLIIVKARLTAELDSSRTAAGAPVEAIVTDPARDGTNQVIYPEGTVIEGAVTRARPARWFARDGQLRFSFRALRLDLPAQNPEPAPSTAPSQSSAPQEQPERPPGPPTLQTRIAVEGHITAAEGDKSAHLEIDDEGGVKAAGGPNKVLAPIALALVAATSRTDDDQDVGQGIVGGSFGLISRIVVLSARTNAVSSGFAIFGAAKSLFTHWIAKGHQVVFPRDTRLSIELAPVRPTVM